MTDLPELRSKYRHDKQEILRSAATSGSSSRGVRATLRTLSALTDELLRGLWRYAGFDAPFVLVAVGGFGRGELFPYSDVDVLLLLPDDQSPDTDERLKGQIEAFIGSCWDAGLEIGSSVRTLADCLAEAAKDVSVQTSLLEARLIDGDAALFNAFRKRFDAVMDPAAFFVAKTLEMRQRHTKFEDTPYALEPNCKESPGGLRDLQIILWVARAAGLGRSWDELARKGLATPFEVRQIKHNEALLSLIRTRLHLIARRREDRLVFDLQTAVAESFGYVSAVPSDGKPGHRPSEVLMKRYYWAAKAVAQLNQILLLNIEERLQSDRGASTHALRPINERFFEKAGMIEVASDDLYQKHPHAILETFLLYQTHLGLKGLSARTLRALYNVRTIMDASFRHDPINRGVGENGTFVQIVARVVGANLLLQNIRRRNCVLAGHDGYSRRICGTRSNTLGDRRGDELQNRGAHRRRHNISRRKSLGQRLSLLSGIDGIKIAHNVRLWIVSHLIDLVRVSGTQLCDQASSDVRERYTVTSLNQEETNKSASNVSCTKMNSLHTHFSSRMSRTS